MKETIRIYVRLKPLDAKQAPCHYETSQETDSPTDITRSSVLQLSIPKQACDGYVNNTRELFRFHFDAVLEGNAQASVFEIVAKPIVDRALDGYNGTLFAYGQTGSGKTYTITGTTANNGKAVSEAANGIIIRALSYIFSKLRMGKDGENAVANCQDDSVSVSYFEIYNEAGYDLLQTRDSLDRLEDLPKIQLLEDADHNVHLRNLSVHPARNEAEALNLLSIGEINRVMAETPMNPTSTRSHCIFTIILNRRDAGSAMVRTSKLHIVDLAGSERVYKSGINGRSLAEAKCINLALHHLEQVIIALADPNRGHVPYRNSMMTAILKDSLGGNSLTSMIATCSLEEANVGETISTCRFAQRVALIRNEVVRNEALDPYAEIDLLKEQIQQLKNTCFLQHGGAQLSNDPLTPDELEKYQQKVDIFLSTADGELTAELDWRMIQQCFRCLRVRYSEKQPAAVEKPNETKDAIDKLEKTLQQRDREMAILCKLLRQEKQRNDQLQSRAPEKERNNQIEPSTVPQPSSQKEAKISVLDPKIESPRPLSSVTFTPPQELLPLLGSLPQLSDSQRNGLKTSLLQVFIQQHPQRDRVEALKRNLLDLANQARSLGTGIRRLQLEIQQGSNQISFLPNSGTGDGVLNVEHDSSKVSHLHGMLEQLRTLKGQVEYFERLTKEVTSVILAQFEQWWIQVHAV